MQTILKLALHQHFYQTGLFYGQLFQSLSSLKHFSVLHIIPYFVFPFSHLVFPVVPLQRVSFCVFKGMAFPFMHNTHSEHFIVTCYSCSGDCKLRVHKFWAPGHPGD